VTRATCASLVVALGALASCGRPEAQPPQSAAAAPAAPPLPPAEAAESLAARTEARRGSLVRKPGSTVAGDAVSQWTAYYSGDTLLLIDDSTSLGDYGASRVRFYYEGGQLRLYVESGRRARASRDGSGSSTLETRIAFDEAGAVAASRFVVDGRDSTLPGTKADEARNRSADLVRRLVLGR
jgi:hypothetical protein